MSDMPKLYRVTVNVTDFCDYSGEPYVDVWSYSVHAKDEQQARDFVELNRRFLAGTCETFDAKDFWGYHTVAGHIESAVRVLRVRGSGCPAPPVNEPSAN